MACLIVSDQIRVQMNNQDMAVPADEITSSTPSSALQRPDMSRMRLSAMLRRNRRNENSEGSRMTWTVVLNSRMAECANSN